MQMLASMFVMNENENKYNSLTIYCISHANHCDDPSNLNKQNIFYLKDQIEHKKNCIKYIIDKNKYYKNYDYVFGGHSIGAYILLKNLETLCVNWANLIFCSVNDSTASCNPVFTISVC